MVSITHLLDQLEDVVNELEDAPTVELNYEQEARLSEFVARLNDLFNYDDDDEDSDLDDLPF